MKVKGLNGKVYSWSLGQYIDNQNTNPSDLHLRVRIFLQEHFPALNILEEVFIPSEHLYLDFFLPVKSLAIEAQGLQHDNFSLYMHKNKLGFNKSKLRDRNKAEFCRLNNIQLIYFYDSESDEEWMNKLRIKKR